MEYAVLLLGLVCAGAGGEVFIRGAVGLASWARIPAGIIGATVAAFATSSPELSVAINAALKRQPGIALGDGLGSNVVNAGLVLAIALLISPTRMARGALRRDFPVALFVPFLTLWLARDGLLSRADGAVLLVFFLGWLAAAVVDARRQRSDIEKVAGAGPMLAVLSSVAGLALLVAAGRLIVTSATSIAHSFGVDPFLIGATVVAVGTSVPELATTVAAKLRGEQEIAVGTILGSNIFNGLCIIGVAAVICPIRAAWSEVSTGLVIGAVLVALTFPTGGAVLDRRRGALLLGIYILYLLMMVLRGGGA